MKWWMWCERRKECMPIQICVAFHPLSLSLRVINIIMSELLSNFILQIDNQSKVVKTDPKINFSGHWINKCNKIGIHDTPRSFSILNYSQPSSSRLVSSAHIGNGFADNVKLYQRAHFLFLPSAFRLPQGTYFPIAKYTFFFVYSKLSLRSELKRRN